MYNLQKSAVLIKELARKKKIALKTMLADCELEINTISRLSNGREISIISFAKIADYLSCSIDFLLGREHNISQSTQFNASNANHVVQVGHQTGDTLLNDKVLSAQEKNLIELFESLTLENSVVLIQKAIELKNK